MERQRKQHIKRGEVTQKAFTFRIDNNNLFKLESLGIQNKGRFINQCIEEKLNELIRKGGL